MANRSGLIFLLLALTVAPFSFAAGVTDLFDRHGFAIYPASNAVSVEAKAAINAVAANGSRAAVPVTAAVNVSKATMALNAARLARAASVVGAGFLAYDIYNAVKESGVTTCPPPDFFCSPGTSGSTPPVGGEYRYGGTTYYASPNAACTARRNDYANHSANASYTFEAGLLSNSDLSPACLIWYYETARPQDRFQISIPLETKTAAGCPAGTTFSNGVCTGGASAPVPFSNDQALADAMAANDWGPALSKRIWDATAAEMARSPGTLSFKDALGAQSPVTVSGSPVVLPEFTSGTSLLQNPDGSTSTEVKKQQTTFTPEKTGTNVEDANITAKETTKTITTVTNNTTNQTTTNTTTNTSPGPAEKEESDLCKLHPEIVACQKLGPELKPVDVPNKEIPLAITKSEGFGPSNGSCPSPGRLTVMGKSFDVPYDLFCTYAQMIRPFVIAVAFMIAVGGFIGLSKKD